MKQGHWQTVAKGSTFFWQRKNRCPQKLEESVHQMQEKNPRAAQRSSLGSLSTQLWLQCFHSMVLWKESLPRPLTNRKFFSMLTLKALTHIYDQIWSFHLTWGQISVSSPWPWFKIYRCFFYKEALGQPIPEDMTTKPSRQKLQATRCSYEIPWPLTNGAAF